MRIGYFGDGPWAHNALKKLIEDPMIDVVFVMPRYDSQDKILIQMAEQNKIPVEIWSNINTDEFLKHIEQYNVDLFVSMSFNQIFKKKTFTYPPLKTINCHAGKLPFYRGRNILNWVLINDEREYGITVHYVDEGIDTGDIILQRTYSITDNDDYSTLLSRAYIDCAEILYESIKLIQDDKVKLIKQNTIDKFGLYCGIRQFGDEIIDWNQSSREIFNFVRAICKPGPMATSYINKKEIKINKVRLIPEAHTYKNIPGQVLGKTRDGFLIKTKDTVIEVIEYNYNGKIKVGDRLKNE